MAKKNENIKEEVEAGKFLTYEDVEKERKRIAKERLNTFLRVVGLVTTILMIVAGLFDVLFEMTYFGKFASFVSGSGEHTHIWEYISNSFEGGTIKIFDDGINIGDWFPKTVLTLVFAAGVVGVIYLVTFSFVDFVDFIKNLIKSSKEIANESAKNVKSSFEGISFKKKKKVDDTDDEEESILKTVPKKKRRNTKNEYGYSDEELDKLLRGEKIEAQKELEDAENKTKALFAEEE